MKRIKLIFIMLLLAMAGNMHGEELVIQDFTISPGETKEVSIELNNPEIPFIALQFYVTLPEGVSIAKDEDDEFLVELNSARIAKSHVLEVSEYEGGKYQFLSYSTKNAAFKGTSGEIINMTLTADASATAGEYQGSITGQVFSKIDETGYTPEDKLFNITIEGEEENITVTAKNYTRKYGEANPTFEYDVEGGTLNGSPEITCEATASSPVGTYPIVVSTGTVTNGSVTYVAGTLTVEKAPLTIKGGTYSMKQGDALPELKAEYEGFKNGEAEDVLTTKPTLSTTATSASAPGEYDVTVSGAVAQNYEITYEKGKITVTQADPVTVTAKSYTIKYGDALPEFEYTSEGATLSGTPEISCEATSASPVGTYDIIISKGSVSNYNVTYVKGTLTIEKAPLSVKGGTYTMKQGDALPELKAEYEGFKNGEAEDVLTTKPTLSTTATSASEPGEYDVTVSGAEAQNYEITYQAGKITVTQADPVTVTAKSYTIKYGDALPEFEYTSEGATLSGTPEISCEATSTSSVGTYDIIISKGTVTNYNVTYVKGTLTIEKAPLAVKGGTYTMKQGDALPELQAEYEGFKNGEAEDVLTTKPTLTTTATSASAPGEYDVTVSGAVAQNYEITYEKGKITVTQADPVTVTAKSYTIKYGDALPTFEYETAGATLTGTPEISCEATATSPVGTYDIIISKGSVSNYNVTYVKGTLTIEKAPLAVKGGTYTMKQGDALPELQAEYEGFKNGETEDVLTTKPTLTTTATSESAPGEYDVTVSGAEAQNYEITYEKGKVTVTQADPVTVTAKSYTIKYGDALPTFEYETEGATLTGTPEISCEATSASPVGTYDIIISKGSVSNYNVTYVKGTLTIEKAPLTIKGGTYTMKQGDALPELKAEYEGFKNGETEDVLTTKPTLTTTATSASAPGEYDVTASGAEAQNYEITYQAGKITVTQADPVTVTAKSYTIKYGDALPEFEYTSEGATLTGTPEISCEATSASPVGTYDIIISKGSVSNYNVTYVKGTLTIEKAPLSVKGGTYTMKQGDALPELKAEYEGFKNGETEDVLTTKPTLTTTATSESAPGEYDVTASGAEAQNYEITYQAGKITVTQADPVTVTAKSYTIKYGETLPAFEYETEGATLTGTPEITCAATSTSSVGTYDIIISKGAVTNYNVTYVKGTLTIEKAPLSVKGGTYTMKQGDALPELKAEYEGFKNGETEDVLTTKPTLTTTATSASAPGEYDVTVSGAEAQNYEITYQAGKITVTQADPVTVTAKSYTIKYGDALPEFEYTSEGATLSGTPEISCSATATSPVGTYDIIISKGSVSNYNVTYVKGTLTIEKAPLTITAKSYSRNVGEENPVFEADYTGFKNDETKEVLTKQPTFTCEANATSTEGEYPIVVSGAEAQNYEITYVDGKLTIDNIMLGDVNGDGRVDQVDLALMVAKLLEKNPAVFIHKNADINKDNVINQIDLALLVRILLEN